jgi:hypothetical protein
MFVELLDSLVQFRLERRQSRIESPQIVLSDQADARLRVRQAQTGRENHPKLQLLTRRELAVYDLLLGRMPKCWHCYDWQRGQNIAANNLKEENRHARMP